MLAETSNIAIPYQIGQKFARLDENLSDIEYQNTRDEVVTEYDAWLDSIGLSTPDPAQQSLDQLITQSSQPEIHYHGLGIPGWVPGTPLIRRLLTAGVLIGMAFGGGFGTFKIKDSLSPIVPEAISTPSDRAPVVEIVALTTPARAQYEKIRFPDPDEFYEQALPESFGNIASLRGQIEATYADVHSAYIDQETGVDPEKYEELKANDPQFKEKINAGVEKFQSINIQSPYYPDNSELLVTKDNQGQVNEFNYPNVEQWRDFFNVIGEYTPQPAAEQAQEEVQPEDETPAAEQVPASAPEARATSIPSADRLPGGLRPYYIKTATDEDISILGNYTRSLETNRVLKEFHQNQGRERVNEIGVTTPANFAQYVSERVPGVDKAALEAITSLGKHKISYNSNGVLKFTDIVLTDGNTNEDLHQISRREEKVLAIEIIYKDGRREIGMIRVMCIQEFGEKVPVAKPAPTEVPTPAPAAVAPAPERPAPTAAPALTSAPTPGIRIPPGPRESAPAPTPELAQILQQFPTEVRTYIRELPVRPELGQQVIILLFDTNNSGVCDDPLEFRVSNVTFNITHPVVINGALGPRTFSVTTNHLGVAIGELRPIGEPFDAFEPARPGMRLIPNQSRLSGRAGLEPAVFCNGPDIPPPPPPPQEVRFPVCMDAFGRTENLTEFQIRQLSSSLGIPNVNFLNINQLQQEIFNRRCVVAITSTSTPTPTFIPSVTPTAASPTTAPSPSPASTGTPEPTPTRPATVTPVDTPVPQPPIPTPTGRPREQVTPIPQNAVPGPTAGVGATATPRERREAPTKTPLPVRGEAAILDI